MDSCDNPPSNRRRFGTSPTVIAGASVLVLGLAACDPGNDDPGLPGAAAEIDLDDPDYAPLSDYKALFEGVPRNDDLPLPLTVANRTDFDPVEDSLMQWVSPVRNQASRGVCSIFSSTALMEHLYIKAGMPDPNFSEQYLQWSTKYLLQAYTDTSGSTDSTNLSAISQWGVPAEADWPYQNYQWGEFEDPACTGEEPYPTRCYTNGFPTARAVAAPKYTMPSSRSINSSPQSIKTHIETNQTGVVVGLDFFYQAWNHRLSTLPRNMDLWYDGVVTYPNDEDVIASHEQQAGHAIFIFGWDDELEIQSRDADGNFIFDENGNPVMEQGFYIFKNSWGTAGFGLDNPYGPGYGYISQRYVQEHGSARVANVPVLNLPPAVEPFNGRYFSLITPVSIPDNNLTGARATQNVNWLGRAGRVRVTAFVQHSRRGDLQVRLVKDGRSVTLHDRTGGSSDHVLYSAVLDDFSGAKRAGNWTLEMNDNRWGSSGTLLFWYLEFEE